MQTNTYQREDNCTVVEFVEMVEGPSSAIPTIAPIQAVGQVRGFRWGVKFRCGVWMQTPTRECCNASGSCPRNGVANIITEHR